jgi:heme/copper-type cytochrome/quinol oxidase subunit 4
MKWSFVVMLWLCAIELTLTWMHAHEALPFTALNKIVLGRRLLSIALQLFTFIYIQGIYNWDGHAPIDVLAAESQCTGDPVLEANFLHMKTYLDNAQKPSRKVWLCIFTISILVANIGGLIFKKLKFDKHFKKEEKNVKNDKKDQLKEPLVPKKDPKKDSMKKPKK